MNDPNNKQNKKPQLSVNADHNTNTRPQKLRSFGEFSDTFLTEFFILLGGMLTGFAWHASANNDPKGFETWNVIIGITIILTCVLRCYWIMRQHSGDTTMDHAMLAFFKEVGVLVMGLTIGMLWDIFYLESPELTTHIIGLQMVLLILAIRFLILAIPKREPDPDDEEEDDILGNNRID